MQTRSYFKNELFAWGFSPWERPNDLGREYYRRGGLVIVLSNPGSSCCVTFIDNARKATIRWSNYSAAWAGIAALLTGKAQQEFVPEAIRLRRKRKAA